jgi:uncharacterized protein with LGFP repeats
VTARLARRLRAGALLVVLAALVTGLLSPTGDPGVPGRSAVAAPELQLTADTREFRAGNVISDNLFFDGGAMNAYQVQDFLNAKGASCVAGAMPCLKDFRENTWNRAADGYCNGYAGAPGETAAWIIAKVGASCGVSQRVLLVLLQKEQGLVRASGTSLTVTRYQKATGYACPDTAPCDAQYYGFYNQVWNAARKYKVYVANFGNYNYRPFRWNTIRYSPDAACGSSSVYIENNATAALYIYTPYQPNAGALAAGYGTAPCGAYGNRNFWLYFTDWFGSTQSPGGNAIVARAATAPSALGAATDMVRCGLLGDGCYQIFQGGSIYWSPSTGARIVWGAIRDRWAALGWERSRLGYPTGEERCGLVAGGCYQFFQFGSVYYSPATGAHGVLGAIRTKWGALNYEKGFLGYPTNEERCGLTGGGCFQRFQGASVYWSKAGGAHPVDDPIQPEWAAGDFERGPLGYPTTDTNCGLRDTGCYQFFTGGAVYSSATEGVHTVLGAVVPKWGQTGYERGALGYPTADTVCGLRDGGCSSAFENGVIAWSPSSGAHVVTGTALDRWSTSSAESGPLGYPTGDTTCGLLDSGCATTFQYGVLYDSASTDVVRVTGAIEGRYRTLGAERSALGYPTADEVCGLAGGGCVQHFQNGDVYWSPGNGARAVSDPVLTEWGPTPDPGRIGYPTGNLACGLRDSGCYQQFAGGMIYTSAGTGTHTVLGQIRKAWAAQGWERGPLGYPTANEVCGLAGGGCSQQFENGSIVWSPTTGARVMSGQIGTYWTAAGAQDGDLGYPTGNQVCGLVGSGCYQLFQGGSVYWTQITGAHAVSGAIRTYWGAGGYERGSLGYPTGDATTSGNETTQTFQRGTLVLDSTTGAVTKRP